MGSDEPPRVPDEESISERKLSIESIPERRDSTPGQKILFAPDTNRPREIAVLPLTRTFSRNSYTSAKDEEEARLKKVTRTRGIEPDVVLPIGSARHRSCG
jgi:hypothetical protein